MEKKVCSKCKEEKEVCEFGKDKTKKSGYKSQCKECVNITSYKYKLLNLDKIKINRKKHYRENFETILMKKKEYYEKNKIKDIIRLKEKYQNDPLHRLKVNLRRRMSSYLKSKNIIKTNTTFNIIGCSPSFLKEHIENQFTEGMTWELIGKHIHIDHIIPLSSANNKEDVYRLCHYTNLQPLWAFDNLSKGDKIL